MTVSGGCRSVRRFQELTDRARSDTCGDPYPDACTGPPTPIDPNIHANV